MLCVVCLCHPPHLTSLRCIEGDRVTVGPIALLVENVDSESVLRKRLEARHNGMTPLPREGQGVTLIQNLVRI